MKDRYHWRRFFWLSLVTGLILISGSGQEVSMTPSLGDNSILDSGLLVPSASALPGEAGANTVAPALGPGVDYTSIQEAIDNSDPGNVIYVQSGTYDEVVTVNKSGLSLKGVDSGESDLVGRARASSYLDHVHRPLPDPDSHLEEAPGLAAEDGPIDRATPARRGKIGKIERPQTAGSWQLGPPWWLQLANRNLGLLI